VIDEGFSQDGVTIVVIDYDNVFHALRGSDGKRPVWSDAMAPVVPETSWMVAYTKCVHLPCGSGLGTKGSVSSVVTGSRVVR
jgi:predicted oxidoreductase